MNPTAPGLVVSPFEKGFTPYPLSVRVSTSNSCNVTAQRYFNSELKLLLLVGSLFLQRPCYGFAIVRFNLLSTTVSISNSCDITANILICAKKQSSFLISNRLYESYCTVVVLQRFLWCFGPTVFVLIYQPPVKVPWRVWGTPDKHGFQQQSLALKRHSIAIVEKLRVCDLRIIVSIL